MAKITLTALRERLEPGTVWEVTNHYITSEGHPCFGTQRREVLTTSKAGFRLTMPGSDEGSHVVWPRAAQVSEEDGALVLCGPFDSMERYLTLRPVGEGAADA
jgi:hypothetical protein